jgi:hypothetical protein
VVEGFWRKEGGKGRKGQEGVERKEGGERKEMGGKTCKKTVGRESPPPPSQINLRCRNIFYGAAWLSMVRRG